MFCVVFFFSHFFCVSKTIYCKKWSFPTFPKSAYYIVTNHPNVINGEKSIVKVTTEKTLKGCFYVSHKNCILTSQKDIHGCLIGLPK